MSVTVEHGALGFDQFWKWLRKHPNCILRAGSPDAFLYDQENLHWHLDVDADSTPLVQLVAGKQLVAEMALDVRDVLFVQSAPDSSGEPGQTVFEVIGGSREEPYAVYHFVLAHAYDEEAAHGALKH
jgi:hypothetical protein